MGFNPHKRIAFLEKRWAADAIRDRNYNLQRAKSVRSPVLKKAYNQEARWDTWWANRRLRIARKEGRY